MSMWSCPSCGRSFKRKGQQHSCALVSEESLFEKKGAVELRPLYEKLVAAIKSIGHFSTEPIAPNTIFFKAASTFMAIKLKKAAMEVEFYSDHLEENKQVIKSLQISKYRVVHVVSLQNEGDISDELIKWIAFSYSLIQS